MTTPRKIFRPKDTSGRLRPPRPLSLHCVTRCRSLHRANVPPTGDVEATQKRQRRMQRLQQALTIANNARSRLR